MKSTNMADSASHLLLAGAACARLLDHCAGLCLQAVR